MANDTDQGSATQSEIPGIPEGEMMMFQELPPAMLNQMTLDRIANLHQPAMQMPAYGAGGAVEDVEGIIDKYLEEIANEHAARAAESGARNPNAPRPPLQQPTEDPLYQEAVRQPAPVKSPLTPGFLSKKQAFADGGTTDPQSSLARLKQAIERWSTDIPFSVDDPDLPTSPMPPMEISPKGQARMAVRAAEHLYGVDKDGNPVFLGGMATRGATPPGIVDEALSIPDSISSLFDTASDLDRAIGLGKFALPKGDPFEFSRNASQRLAELNAAVAKDTGVGAPQGVAEDAEDLAGQIGPLAGASRIAKEGTVARQALDQLAGWGGAGSQGSARASPSWLSQPSDETPVEDAALADAAGSYNKAGGGEVDLGRRALLKLLGAVGATAAAAKPELMKLAEKVGMKAPEKAAATAASPAQSEVAKHLQGFMDEFFGPSDEPEYESAIAHLQRVPGSEKLQSQIGDYQHWLQHDSGTPIMDENWERENLGKIVNIHNSVKALAETHSVKPPIDPNAGHFGDLTTPED